MLQVFRSLPIARETYRLQELPARARDYARDTITLAWEERLKARGRRRSDGGVEFGTTLERGSCLREGDVLVLDDLRVVVAVIEKAEEVFLIEPANPVAWGLFAYHIGNSHQPLMLTDVAIICPDVPGMEQLLTYHNIPFARAMRSFTPITGDLDSAVHRHHA